MLFAGVFREKPYKHHSHYRYRNNHSIVHKIKALSQGNKTISKLSFTSLIQTLLSPLELHKFMPSRLAGFTAGHDLRCPEVFTLYNDFLSFQSIISLRDQLPLLLKRNRREHHCYLVDKLSLVNLSHYSLE